MKGRIIIGGIVGVLAIFSVGQIAFAVDSSSEINVNIPARLSITSSKSTISLNPSNPNSFYADFTSLTVNTNNATGYTLTMSDADNDTSLKHSNSAAYQIPTVSSDTNKSEFLANKWGYSLDDNLYKAIPSLATPTTLMSSTAPTTDNFNFYVGTKIDNSMVSGLYKDKIVFSAVANYVPVQNTFGGITTMQEMTTQICTDETKPSKEATNTTIEHTTDTNLVPEATLTDTRDGKTYVVRKLADGNCWMSQNLALSPNGSTTYTEADTDLHDGRIFQAPAASSEGDTWNMYGSDGPHYLKPQVGYEFFQNGTTASSTGQPTESTGNYYDWPMATAMSGQSLTNNGDEAPDSICPKGWRLPPKEGDKSYHNLLFTNYNLSDNSESAAKLLLSPLSFVRAGGYDPRSNFSFRGDVGPLWTSTVYTRSGAYIFGFSDGSVDYDYQEWDLGVPVRCVAR